MNRKKLQSTKKGFTIIETLVSLSILAFAVLGLVVITSQGVADTNFSKNKLVASALAQEGIELVRNMRDSAALAGTPWQNTFSASTSITGLSNCYANAQQSGCDIDAYSLAVTRCAAASRTGCGPLRYNTATGAFRSSIADPTSPETVFSRVISLRDISPNEVEVTSTVTWTQGNATKSLSVVETLFDWVTIAPAQ